MGPELILAPIQAAPSAPATPVINDTDSPGFDSLTLSPEGVIYEGNDFTYNLKATDQSTIAKGTIVIKDKSNNAILGSSIICNSWNTFSGNTQQCTGTINTNNWGGKDLKFEITLEISEVGNSGS